MKRTITVTHEDLDKALASKNNVPYVSHCLIAQSGKRQGFRTDLLCLEDLPLVYSADLNILTNMYDVMRFGDSMFLAMLEAVLPMEIEIEHE